jgi:hypothetical protein
MLRFIPFADQQPADQAHIWVRLTSGVEFGARFIDGEVCWLNLEHDRYIAYGNEHVQEWAAIDPQGATGVPLCAPRQDDRLDAATHIRSLAFAGVLPDRFEQVADWIAAGKLPPNLAVMDDRVVREVFEAVGRSPNDARLLEHLKAILLGVGS